VDAMPAGRYVSTRRVSAGERATDEVEGKLRLLVRGARTGSFVQQLETVRSHLIFAIMRCDQSVATSLAG
jgi:hypothetical protein